MQVLQTLLSLNIKEVNLDKSAVRKKIAKKDKYKLSRRERKVKMLTIIACFASSAEHTADYLSNHSD